MAARKKPGVLVTPEKGMAMIGALCALPIAAVIGFLIRSAVMNYELADKPFVERGLQMTKAYVDERTSATLKEAYEHSDANRQHLLLKMQEMRTEQREDSATLKTKIEMVLERLAKNAR